MNIALSVGGRKDCDLDRRDENRGQTYYVVAKQFQSYHTLMAKQSQIVYRLMNFSHAGICMHVYGT